jgi:hypothetical protein
LHVSKLIVLIVILEAPPASALCAASKSAGNRLISYPRMLIGLIAMFFAVYILQSVCVDVGCNASQCMKIDSAIDVEIVDKCVQGLRNGKACGLSAEHLQHAHPLLTVLLTALFRSMAVHSYVPVEFGKGIVVPLVTDKAGDLGSTSNYRTITLIPIASKLFESIECVILKSCSGCFESSELQFGFKEGVGCPNAMFAMRSRGYYTDRGSTVFAVALDISKAYDKVNNFELYTTLLKSGCPVWVVNILIDWYSKLYVVVRWNGRFSSSFKVESGVRQVVLCRLRCSMYL